MKILILIAGVIVGILINEIVERILIKDNFTTNKSIFHRNKILLDFLVMALIYSFYRKSGLNIIMLQNSFLIIYLLIVGIIDFKTTYVYFSTTIVGLIGSAILLIIKYYLNYNIKEYLLSGFLIFVLIMIAILITKGVGWGDAEICLVIGLMTGMNSIFIMILSLIMALLTSIMLLIIKRKKKNDLIAFGPFLAVAGILISLV